MLKKIFAFFSVYVIVTNVAMGHVLHVGDTTLNLFDASEMTVSKRTPHTLNFLGKDGHTYFIDMIPAFVPNTLHAVFDGIVHSSCLVATGFYCIKNGINIP